ncbi:IQ and AAA domain-containing 1-like protein [Labeo rohita]|uniref:IQ and AAA domain-containing 1-like protein n=1 Tax=Labeo rohita TaxID=84645 RepID=A0A498P4X8_LABRO|nr:IQ and AAA domain-containing 1-like protein [Labeo rohita]RXN39108.1 IQ and AAA domain-containing 1-like protein [Labeo rohita]
MKSLLSYGQMWDAAQGALEDLLEDEYPTMQLRPQKDRLQVFQTLATFYLRYLKIFRALEEVYDQIVHPQKRRVVHQVLEGVMGRLVELKNEMVELEYSEFHYFDDILQDFKMTPEDLEIPIPRYFVREKMRALKEREKMLAHILAKGGRQEHKTQMPVQSMSVERAVWLLQVSERARQGRLRAHFMKTIRLEEQRRLQGSSSMLDPDQAATCIQKVWRGHRDRRRVNKECLEEMIFLGMIPDLQTTPSPAQLHAQQVESKRHCVQEEHEAEYQRALVNIKEAVRSVDGQDIKESLQEQIRQWFIECRDATGKFPDFPSPEDGGSASIFAQKTPEQEEEKGWKMTPSNFLPTVVEGAKLYKGEYSYLGTTLRQADIEPMPSLSDVRQLIALYGVLPLGSQCVHERGPLIRALLLTGPAGVGKKMLVHALCTETGANLFDLSPSTLAGKYPGKSGLQYLLHMVFKVARQLQPSVIWIGDAEKTFYKKVPKLEKETEPKRLKKNLPKVLKSIKPEDRVLLVGTTRRPFDADMKPFCKVYKKIILIPRPDYASRFTLWKELLQAGGAQLGPKLDLSSLSKVTDGYTQGHILQAIQTVLNSHRLSQQTKRPLTAVEFIPPLARQDPVYKEEEEAYKAWYSRTPLGKKRARAAKASEEEGDQKKGKTKGGKSKKKGKEGKTKKRKKKK